MTKREVALIILVLFLFFVLMGINKKYGELSKLSVIIGITKKQTIMQDIMNYFLIGIGLKK